VIRLLLGLLILVGTALLINEVSGWLGLIPRGILRLAAMRLPADLRQAVYREEWLPELLRELREAEGRPITRLVVGIKYAVDIGRGAGKVGRELEGVRKPEREISIPTKDVVSSDELTMSDVEAIEDVYKDRYGPDAGGVTVTGKGVETSAAGVMITAGFRLSGSGTVSASGTPGPDDAGT
jgi:hypothetical protein